MKTKKKNLPSKNYIGNFIKYLKKSNFAIFIVIICLALIFCVVTLNSIIDIAYGVNKSKETNDANSSQYSDLFIKIDNLSTSESNNQTVNPSIKNPFSGQ